MRKIVGISGGDLKSTDVLNRYAIQMTAKDKPHILFVPTASKDATGYIGNIERYYGELNCEVRTLLLCEPCDSEEIIKEKIDWSDLIYVGGGDTESMLEVWKKHNVDKCIVEACDNGKVLTGISAGTIFWFAYGHSDSDYFKNPDDWSYKFVKGLDVLHLAVCPHYNEEGRDSFDKMLENLAEDIDGLALENDTAIVVEGNLLKIMKGNEKNNVYYFKRDGDKYTKCSLKNGQIL